MKADEVLATGAPGALEVALDAYGDTQKGSEALTAAVIAYVRAHPTILVQAKLAGPWTYHETVNGLIRYATDGSGDILASACSTYWRVIGNELGNDVSSQEEGQTQADKVLTERGFLLIPGMHDVKEHTLKAHPTGDALLPQSYTLEVYETSYTIVPVTSTSTDRTWWNPDCNCRTQLERFWTGTRHVFVGRPCPHRFVPAEMDTTATEVQTILRVYTGEATGGPIRCRSILNAGTHYEAVCNRLYGHEGRHEDAHCTWTD